MAEWSPNRRRVEAELRAAAVERALANHLAERAELFKTFRAGGWKVVVLMPVSETIIKPDNWPVEDCHFSVKMPGAAQARIKTMDQLRRLAKGVR